jgi:hypothetical protein
MFEQLMLIFSKQNFYNYDDQYNKNHKKSENFLHLQPFLFKLYNTHLDWLRR